MKVLKYLSIENEYRKIFTLEELLMPFKATRKYASITWLAFHSPWGGPIQTFSLTVFSVARFSSLVQSARSYKEKNRSHISITS